MTFPLPAPTTVTLTLRDLLPTDPPITIDLPRLLRDAVSGRVEMKVSNSGQAGATGAD